MYQNVLEETEEGNTLVAFFLATFSERGVFLSETSIYSVLGARHDVRH
jgi:hypothetical protein